MVIPGLLPSQLRGLGVAIGAGYLYGGCYGVIVLGCLSRAEFTPHAALSLMAGMPGIVLLVAAILNRVTAIRPICLIATVAYLVAAWVWTLAPESPADPSDDFWMARFVLLPCMSALVALPVRCAVVVLPLNCLSVEITRSLIEPTPLQVSLARGLLTMVQTGFFILVTVAGLRKMRAVATQQELVQQRRAQTRALLGRAEETDRLDRLTHDNVLSLLSAAAEGVPAEKLAVQAASVRRRLNEGFQDRDDTEALSVVVERIGQHATGAGLTITTTGEPRGLIRRTIGAELETAVEEAIRNVTRHAGGRGRVELTLGVRRLRALVIDSGPGFETEATHLRLGVRHGILGRVDALPHARASIESVLGTGTTVTVEWAEP